VSWQEVVQPLSSLEPAELFVPMFLSFIAFTYFAVLNVVTGVFCQTAIESATQDHDMVIQSQMNMKQQYIDKLKVLFANIDVHSTGKITLAEFEDCLQEERLQAYFHSMEISVDEAFSLFKLLDTDESHQIDIDSFITGCLRLRGSAKAIDIAMLMYEMRWTMQRYLSTLKSFSAQFNHLGGILGTEFSPPEHFERDDGSLFSKDGFALSGGDNPHRSSEGVLENFRASLASGVSGMPATRGRTLSAASALSDDSRHLT